MEAGQKRVPQKQVRGVSIISLALNLAMLIVGAQYNSDEQCKLEVSQYIYILDAVRSSGILKAKQKLGITFNFDKQDIIDLMKFSKMTMCRASEANSEK